MLTLGGFLVVAGLVARLAPRAAALARGAGVAASAEDRLAGWFLPAQAALAAVVLALSVWVCSTFETVAGRLAGPVAAALVLASCAAAAGRRPRVSPLPAVTPLLAVVAAAEVTWAALDPGVPVPWLHRSARLLVVVSVFAVLYALPRRSGRWTVAALRLSSHLAVAA